jgi:hypothetical protein
VASDTPANFNIFFLVKNRRIPWFTSPGTDTPPDLKTDDKFSYP